MKYPCLCGLCVFCCISFFVVNNCLCFWWHIFFLCAWYDCFSCFIIIIKTYGMCLECVCVLVFLSFWSHCCYGDLHTLPITVGVCIGLHKHCEHTEGFCVVGYLDKYTYYKDCFPPSFFSPFPPSFPSSPSFLPSHHHHTHTGTNLHGPHPQPTATAEDPFLTGCRRTRKSGVLGLCETGPGDVCIPSGRLSSWRKPRFCSHTERQPRDATHSQEGAYSYLHTAVSS